MSLLASEADQVAEPEILMVPAKNVFLRMGLVHAGGSEYGLQRVLGGPKNPEVGIYWGEGMYAAMQMLMGEGFFISGSAVSKTVNTKEEHLHWPDNSPFIEMIKPVLVDNEYDDGGLFWRYHTGEIDCRGLSNPGYYVLRLMDIMRGANVDIVGKEQLGDYDKSIEMLYKLVRFNGGYPVDGPLRVLSEMEYYPGGLHVIHMEQKYTTSDAELNMVLLPSGYVDSYSNISSRRSGQQATTRMGKKNLELVINRAPMLNDPLKMIGWPTSEGSYMNYAARAVRSILMESGKVEEIDHRSFFPRRVWAGMKGGGRYSMSEALSVPANLIPAIFDVGHTKVIEAAEKLGIHLGRYLHEKPLIEKQMLSGYRELVSGDPNPGSEKVIRYLAKMVAYTTPVSWEEAMASVTAPESREVVRGELSGMSGLVDGTASEDALGVMRELEQIARFGGDDTRARLIAGDIAEIEKFVVDFVEPRRE